MTIADKNRELDKGIHKDLYILIHNLNQPLTAINNYAHAGIAMLATGNSNKESLAVLFEKITEQVTRSNKSTKELSQLVDSLLDTKDNSD